MLRPEHAKMPLIQGQDQLNIHALRHRDNQRIHKVDMCIVVLAQDGCCAHKIGDLWLNQYHVCRGKIAHEIRHRQRPDVTEEQVCDFDNDWRWQQHRLADFAGNPCRSFVLPLGPIDNGIDEAGVE
jgi:hypothetical protein